MFSMAASITIEKFSSYLKVDLKLYWIKDKNENANYFVELLTVIKMLLSMIYEENSCFCFRKMIYFIPLSIEVLSMEFLQLTHYT